MPLPEKIGNTLNKMFDGYPPTQERLKNAKQYRRAHLPARGLCQEKTDFFPGLGQLPIQDTGCLGKKAYIEICRQLEAGNVDPDKVCQNCEYVECPFH